MDHYDEEDLELIEGFREESNDHIEIIEEQLLQLEHGEFQLEPINLIFRSIHTIKGGSGFLGLTQVKDLSHKMESLLDQLRNGDVQFDDRLADILLRGTDRLKEMFQDLTQAELVDIAEEMSALEKILGGDEQDSPSEEKKARSAILVPIEGRNQQQVESCLKRGFHFFEVEIEKSRHKAKMKQQSFEDLVSYFDSFGMVVAQAGLLDEASLTATILFGSVLEGEFAAASLGVEEDALLSVDSAAIHCLLARKVTVDEALEASRSNEKGVMENQSKNSKPNPGSSKNVISSSKSVQKASTPKNLKVSTHLLGKLMSLAGELILCRNQLLQEVSEAELPVLHTLNQRLSELQETVMKTRLQPVGTVFNKVPRLVRDLSRSLDKHVEVKLEGVEVELDRTMIDAISDPLTHLVRNSIDHGFETRSERKQTSKPEACLLSLRAYHEGGLVNIEIKDDGRGIDVNKIKAKALEKGLISGPEAEAMGQRESLNLLFRPGFSTASTITEISGRGVGMDVVKTGFEKIGGTVDLFSEKGSGTTVLVKLPTTLAIVSAVIAEVENLSFAISQSHIEEIVRLKEGEMSSKLERMGSFEVLRLRGQLLPIIRLADVLGLGRTYRDDAGHVNPDRRVNLADRRSDDQVEPDGETRSGQERRRPGRTFYIVVIRVGRNLFGVLINRISNTEEIVIKSLSSFIKDIPCFHGATIRGDGKVILILDGNGLAKVANLKFSELDDMSEVEKTENEEFGRERQTLLVFNNCFEEQFAMPLSFISRIEKVLVRDVVEIGEREFIQISGKNVPLVRLEQHLNVRPIDSNEDGSFFVLIPNMVASSQAIVCSKVLDVVTTSIELESHVIEEDGVLGTCILGGKTTLVLDMFGLYGAHLGEDHGSPGLELQDARARRILLVEDTPFFQTMISTYLQQTGFQVVHAWNGREALDRLENETVDLILSDIEMPIMDGFELAQQLRKEERWKAIPLLAVTALEGDDVESRALQAGFDSYQAKLNKRALLEAIHKLLAEAAVREPE